MNVACRMKIATSALEAIGRYTRAKMRQVDAPSSTAASKTLCAMPVKKLRITNAENGIEIAVYTMIMPSRVSNRPTRE